MKNFIDKKTFLELASRGVSVFQNQMTNSLIYAIQWNGKNLKEVEKFCLPHNVKVSEKEKDIEGNPVLMVKVQRVDKDAHLGLMGKIDKKWANCGVYGQAYYKDWITWNGVELFPVTILESATIGYKKLELGDL